MSEQATEPTHTVTLQFSGPLSAEMADHFFSSWINGEISQAWAEALDEADIAESIVYDGDEETRTLSIQVSADDEDDSEDESDEESSATSESDETSGGGETAEGDDDTKRADAA